MEFLRPNKVGGIVITSKLFLTKFLNQILQSRQVVTAGVANNNNNCVDDHHAVYEVVDVVHVVAQVSPSIPPVRGRASVRPSTNVTFATLNVERVPGNFRRFGSAFGVGRSKLNDGINGSVGVKSNRNKSLNEERINDRSIESTKKFKNSFTGTFSRRLVNSFFFVLSFLVAATIVFTVAIVSIFNDDSVRPFEYSSP